MQQHASLHTIGLTKYLPEEGFFPSRRVRERGRRKKEERESKEGGSVCVCEENGK